MRKVVSIIPVLSILFLNPAGADNTERQKQIEEFQERLSIKRSQYEQLAGREKDQIDKLRSIEEQVALSNQLILKVKRETERLQKSISGRGRELELSKSDYEKKKQALYKRMKYIYKRGKKPAWLSLISSGNPTEAVVSFKNMKSLMEYDRQLVSSLQSISRGIETELREMKAEKRLLEDLEKDYREELELRKSSLSIRKELLDKIRNDKSVIAKAITSIEDDAAAVSEIIAGLNGNEPDQADYPELKGLENDRGNLIWPIQGKIIRSYGTTKDKRGIKLTNPGIDIKGTSGARVTAAATGKIIYVSWLRGYGQFIILNHGRGYYTLYANLTDIYGETGDMIKAGEIIAEIGDPGSLEGSTLHFEVRYKKESLDPLKWLR